MPYRSGRHFLQIPGPTNVPERVLRAIDSATIDHRGPEFGKMGLEILEGLKAVFQTKAPVVIYPASGTGAWEAALVNTLSPGDRVLMFETGHFASLWHKMAARLGVSVDLVPTDWRRGVDPAAVEAKLKEDREHKIKAVCVVHNETSTGVTSRIGAIRKAVDAARHPALYMVDTISSLASIDYRHDEWGVDVTVGLAKRADAAPGAVLQRGERKGAQGLAVGEAAALLLELGGDHRQQQDGLLPLHPRDQPPLRVARIARDADGGGPRKRLCPPRAPRGRHAPRGARLGPGDPVRGARGVLELAHRRDDARGPRRRRAAPDHPRGLRHVARIGPRQARRESVPHRAPGRLQRPHARRRARRSRDGPRAGQRPPQEGRRARRAGPPCRERARGPAQGGLIIFGIRGTCQTKNRGAFS